MIEKVLACEDNLKWMKSLPSGCADLLYMDPPFMTGRDFGEFDDRWGMFNKTELKGAPHQVADVITNSCDVHSPSMGAYLAFMAPRIKESKRLLRPTGALWIHCDTNAGAWLRILTDFIVGASLFRNEVVWKRSVSKGGRGLKVFGRTTDRLLYYGMHHHYPSIPRDKSRKPAFPREDDKGKWRPISRLDCDKALKKCARFEWRGRNPELGWRMSFDNLEKLHREGRIWESASGTLYRKQYEDEWNGFHMGELWDDIGQRTKTEGVGWPTQKPERLMMRIIETCTYEGGLVIDPFCGSGTTLVVAEATGRRWAGCDSSWEAVAKAADRLDERSNEVAGDASD